MDIKRLAELAKDPSVSNHEFIEAAKAYVAEAWDAKQPDPVSSKDREPLRAVKNDTRRSDNR